MPYRLTRAAEDQVEKILVRSAREFGLEASQRYQRYQRLLITAMASVGNNPQLAGFCKIARLEGVFAYPAALTRMRTPFDERVARPRHLIIYRVCSDGMVEILGVVHDRMLLSRAARKAVRDAAR